MMFNIDVHLTSHITVASQWQATKRNPFPCAVLKCSETGWHIPEHLTVAMDKTKKKHCMFGGIPA